MDFISKLEKRVLGWVKNVPHLPTIVKKWLGENFWRIALIGAIFSGISFLFEAPALIRRISLLSAASSSYYVVGSNFTSLEILNAAVNLFFIIASGLLLAFAVKPLQKMQKKGWVLLFLTLLVEALSVIVGAVLTFSAVSFVISILFGGIGLVIGAYFVAEIHGQFSQPAKATIKKL